MKISLRTLKSQTALHIKGDKVHEKLLPSIKEALFRGKLGVFLVPQCTALTNVPIAGKVSDCGGSSAQSWLNLCLVLFSTSVSYWRLTSELRVAPARTKNSSAQSWFSCREPANGLWRGKHGPTRKGSSKIKPVRCVPKLPPSLRCQCCLLHTAERKLSRVQGCIRRATPPLFCAYCLQSAVLAA